VDANSHTYFSPRARFWILFPRPASFPKLKKQRFWILFPPPASSPKLKKQTPLSPLSAHVPHHLSDSHSPFLPRSHPFSLSPSIYFRLSLSLSPKIKIHKKFKNPSPLPKIGDSFFFLSFFLFPPLRTTSRPGTPSSSRSARPPSSIPSWSVFFLINSNPPVRSFLLLICFL
jgi:hypothetical protein